jgi:diguanylate cyclase (GGDEF)-like protein
MVWSTSVQESLQPMLSTADGPPVRILIVDDSPDQAFLTAQALRRGLVPSVATIVSDGASCLEAVRQQEPDAIVMDYRLPDTDGLTLLSKLQDLTPVVPVIFATGEGNEDVAVAAMKLGAADYIVKEGDYLKQLPAIIRLGIEQAQQTGKTPDGGDGPTALLDEATGVFSEEAFRAFAEILTAETGRRRSSFGVILVEIDEAAVWLPEPGNGCLDALLRVVAGAMLRTARRSDLIGRRGPRGFSVVAQGTDLRGTLLLAERFRAGIPDRLTVDERQVTLTITQGLASMPQDGKTLQEVLVAATDSLDEARSQGGRRIIASRSDAGTIAATPVFGATLQTRQAAAVEQHRADLASLTAAYNRGEITGIAIQTHTGACSVCADAARDLYKPSVMLPLPVVGCNSPGGCRCRYSVPGLTGRDGPPPVPTLDNVKREIPRRWRDAALFGSEPKRSCNAEVLAEYLDAYSLIPFNLDVLPRDGEVGYLRRPARRGWEHVTPASAMIHGPQIPLTQALRPWAKALRKPPFLPPEALPYREEGLLYLTNYRLIFRQRQSSESILLVDISALECLREGLACVINGHSNRLVFLSNDGPQLGLCIARAIRDIAKGRVHLTG